MTRSRLTTGEAYVGNQTYRGMGNARYCPLCGCHKSLGGGHFQKVKGVSSWVCKLHERGAK